jgi:O-antigen/teichoic acid export membrane protein
MIDQKLQRDTGSAILWKSFQMGGTKIIYFVRLFVLAQLLTPADFGLMAVAMVAIDVLLSITDFGMIPALVQQKDVQSSHYNAAWTIGLVRALAISLIVFVTAPLIVVVVDEPQVLEIMRVLALLPTIDALASIGLAGLMRNLAFRDLAILDIARTLLNTVISILLASTMGVWALVAGSIAGSMTFTVASYLLAPYRPRLTFDRQDVGPLIHYGRWIFLTSLVAVSGSAVLRIVVSRQLGAAELGLYFLAAKLAFLPTEVAIEVIGGVAFPIYARLQTRMEQAVYIFRTNLVSLAVLLIPIFSLIIVLAPGLVQYILGPSWQGADQLIQLLAVVGILGLVTDAAVPAFKGLGYPSIFMLIEAAQSALLILFVYWFTSYFGLLGAALAWYPAILASLAIAFVFLRRIFTRPFAGVARPVTAIAVSSLLGGAITMAVYHITPTFVGFILAGIIGVVVISGLIWLLNQLLKLHIGGSLTTLFPQVLHLLSALRGQHGAAR